jgi:hypothetical protein
MSCWLTWRGVIAEETDIFYVGDTSFDGYGILIPRNSNEIGILLGGILFFSAGYNLTINQTLFLSLTVDINNDFCLFVNGSNISCINSGGSPYSPSLNTFIGHNLNGEISLVQVSKYSDKTLRKVLINL